MTADSSRYGASHTARRRRATPAEMEARYDRLAELADVHHPCSVRHLFYRAVVDGMPGIGKDDAGYAKVQRAVLHLRRIGDLPYPWIVDNSRTHYDVDTWNGTDGFLADMAGLYRRDLWVRSPWRVEVWCESDSIAGTIRPVTTEWRVPLFPIRGQSSETFAYAASRAWAHQPHRQVVALYVGDHDPAGLEIETALVDKLATFAADAGLDHPPRLRRIGVTWDQVVAHALPGTTPKKPYGYPLAVEAEALEPQLLRDLLDDAIAGYVDRTQLAVLRAVEAEEREGLARLTGRA